MEAVSTEGVHFTPRRTYNINVAYDDITKDVSAQKLYYMVYSENVNTFTSPEDYKKSPFLVRKLGLWRNCVTSRKCVRSELYTLQVLTFATVWQHYWDYRTINTKCFVNL